LYVFVGNKTQTMSHPRNATMKIILKAVSILIFLALSLVIGELIMGRDPFPVWKSYNNEDKLLNFCYALRRLLIKDL